MPKRRTKLGGLKRRHSRVVSPRMHVDPVGARYRLGHRQGHYESWFIRGNHPTRPRAFWVRYTVTSPKNRPEDAVAELFAALFDGETKRHVATRQAFPVSQGQFPTDTLGVRIADARLEPDHLTGAIERGGERVAWDVRVHDGGPPLYLFPENLYAGGFPKAKALVMRTNVTFGGHFDVAGERLAVDGWVGSTNHNWGSKHTDHYVWGQVAGFDDAPGTFLELATARIKLAGVMTPPMTPIVLRHDGREFRLNALHTLFGRATARGLDWSFRARGKELELVGRIHSQPSDCVVFMYQDPPGGWKWCINSKIAACELELVVGGRRKFLKSASRAAMELFVHDPRAEGLINLPQPI